MLNPYQLFDLTKAESAYTVSDEALKGAVEVVLMLSLEFSGPKLWEAISARPEYGPKVGLGKDTTPYIADSALYGVSRKAWEIAQRER